MSEPAGRANHQHSEPDGATVTDLIEAAARRHGDLVAVEAGDRALTYGQLDRRADRLARRLRALGVGPDVPVGVCLGRSLAMPVALWAVLKAGGSCLPLDPSYPAERLALMVEDAGVAAVVTRDALAGRLPAVDSPVVLLDGDDVLAGVGDDDSHDVGPPERSSGPGDVAYVIYTSGSTGRPKGVLLTHGGLVNHHRAAVDLYRLAPGDRVLQFCSVGFDASIEELFPTWVAGATVVFRPDDAPVLGRDWAAWLRRRRLTVLNLPTAYWHEWTRDLDARGEAVPDDLRLVIVGGEKALGPVHRRWARLSGGRSRWVNAYGPTETTCMSTVWEAPPGYGGDGAEGHAGDDSGGDPPIGRPLPGTVVRVVDDRLEPVPAGATGELLIGGAGLARGYLDRPELTAERFVVDPALAPGDPYHRLYRTGDLVRLLPGGDLDYVGRIDDQVKIRGFRIECGEVEAALARHPGVAAAAVVARHDPPDEKRLVGYVVPAGPAPAPAELRHFLGRRLPDHMVPAAFVVLEALPLSPNGKLDRAALPPPGPPPATPGQAGAGAGVARAGPRTPGEQAVAAIWARVLGLDPGAVGRDDDFFELGGHSLLAARVVAQIREDLGTETPLRALFESPTVAGLAALVEAEAAGPTGLPVLGPRPPARAERAPATWAQEQMWRLEVAADPPGLYNITALLPLDEPVDAAAVAAALADLTGRHEILRTGFVAEAGRPWQRIAPAVEVELGQTDLRAVPAAEVDGRLRRGIAEHDARPFDLERPPLLRAHLFRLPGPTGRLAVTLDHLVGDGTTA
ncbi:MAG TPA: amino acid adenylation domain-containing protein, partial [Acidimicrobiales bacterium]|nr:amino acid adenylation domain-containing protein [Acidimicrobiales bacterium]